jgi:hypothetical protein
MDVLTAGLKNPFADLAGLKLLLKAKINNY